VSLPRSSPERFRSNGDPTHLKRSNTKSHHARKGRYDGGFTPSEQRLKAKLMRQFIRGYDGPRGNTEEYRNSPLWCSHPGCRRMNGTHTHEETT
jgi:hypothetical protein